MKLVAAILGGGVGIRVRSVLADTPKVLAPVNGIPFVSYLLDQLADTDALRVVVCAGHGGDRVRRALESARRDIPIVISQETWPMGTGGALRQAIPYFDCETVLVLNGDSYVDTKLAQFCEWLQPQPFESAVLVTWTENCAGARTVELDPAGRVLSFRQPTESARPGWTDAGVYLLSRAWLESMPENTPLSLEQDVLPYWIERGIGAFCVHAPLLDIGTPEGMATAPAFFESVRNRGEWKLAAGGQRCHHSEI